MSCTLFKMNSEIVKSERSQAVAGAGGLGGHPLAGMDPTDLSLIVSFVLCSGSLKALAKERGVSYPTIRARLDGLIERLRDSVEGRERDPLADTLADLVERGEMSVGAARRVLEAAKQTRSNQTRTQ